MVSVLVKIFGTENIEMAEDVVQDALVTALETWKYKGMPDNPRAWLYRVARNKAIDVLRKNKHSKTIDFSDPERVLLTSEYTLSSTMDQYWKDDHIKDDFLAMMFACCHPGISPENQVTFILKSLCGFSTREIARTFLTSEDTISKRLYRTKEFFRTNKIRPEIPDPEDIDTRIDAVLSSIYLLFNEGYSSTHSDDLIRKDLISQALHLCKVLLAGERTKTPDALALMALMCFHSARSEGRTTSKGELIPLSRQDRSTWNRELIGLGRSYLHKAGQGATMSSYHFEAAIAHEHCRATSYTDTNWEAILGCYDAMLRISNDPVVQLNRCLVLMESQGPESALAAIEKLKDTKVLKKYYLYHAGLGAIYQKLGRNDEAAQAFQEAAKLTQSSREKKFLETQINSLLNRA